MERWECYIEEYKTENGLSARLRDKKTGKKVLIEVRKLEDRSHFLEFLSQAKINEAIMPTIFKKDGDDIIAVYGAKQKEDSETIFVDTDTNGGGYRFE